MKVLDLRCAHGHVFEGWFSSEEDYRSQRTSGLLACPVCGHIEVEKGLSAPRLQAKSNTRQAAEGQTQRPLQARKVATQVPTGRVTGPVDAMAGALADRQARLQAEWLQMARQMVAQADDVGTNFAQEARRIHAGDAPERAIHGQASMQEAQELLEEGIAVLPLPELLKNTLQ